MNARLLLLASVILGIGFAPCPSSHAAELQLDVVHTSPGQIELRWSKPASATGFDHYDVLRSGILRVPATGAALGIFGAAALATALLLRRRRWASAALGGLSLAAGLQAVAAVRYDKINSAPITNFDATTYIDSNVEAGLGYYYKIEAVFTGQTQLSVFRYGSAEAPIPISQDSGLFVQFQPGQPPNETPADGAILEGSNTATVNGCIATESADCGARRIGRSIVSGELHSNLELLQSGLSSVFAVAAGLDEGPSFVQISAENDAGKSITVARTVSVGQSALSGTLIPKAVGVVISPQPDSGPSLLEKLRTQINDQTPADWNEIFAQLPYPLEIEANEPEILLQLDISKIEMDADGDATATVLELAGASPSSAVLDVDLLVDGVDVEYTRFEGDATLGANFTGHFCPGAGLNRIRVGRVHVRARATLFLEAGQLRLDLAQLQSAEFLVDDAANTSDALDTDRRLGGELCLVAIDPDKFLFPAVNGQLDSLFPVDVTEAAISDIELGDTGLTLDLEFSELSQDAAGKGLVLRADAAIDSSSPVAFLRTDNPPPNGSANNSVFPDSFSTIPDAGLTLADDLMNEGLAAARAAGLLDGDIEGSLQVGDANTPLTVAGLDPGPSAAESLLPDLSRRAPRNAPVLIRTAFTLAPVVGLLENAVRAQGGLRILVSGFTAQVLVDVDLDGAYDAESETALSLDLDVLATTNVTLSPEGGLLFDVDLPVQGYTATAGFLDLPHAEIEELAKAIIANRVNRILELIDGIGSSGLVVPGLTFTTLDAVADGDSNLLYQDNLTAWGAASIDLKTLIQEILDLINEQPREPS